MQALPRIIVGDRNLSSWSLRAWLALAQSGLAFEEIQLRFDAADFRTRVRALSPTAKVPVLIADGVTVWESLAICEWVAERAPELWPAAAGARAVARAVSHEMHAGFAALRGALPMDVARRYPRRPLRRPVAADVTRIEQLWADCRARFGEGGPFLFGRFSVADAMFAPVATRFLTYDITMSEASAAYVEALLGLPAMQAWCTAAKAEVDAGSAPDQAVDGRWMVVFYSERTGDATYGPVAEEMARLAAAQPGFLGVESVRGADGAGITVSYWDSREAIDAWRAETRHRAVQAQHARFYTRWHLATGPVFRDRAWAARPTP